MAIGITVSIGGSSYPIRPNSLSIVDALDQNEMADFDLDDRHGGLTVPSLFQSVTLSDGAYTLFRGDVDLVRIQQTPSPYDVTLAGTHHHSTVYPRIIHVRCQGLSANARRLLTGSFSASARIDLATVVATLAAGLGISTDIDTSTSPLPLTNSFLSEQETLADAFTRLADLATSMTGVIHIWKIAEVSGTVTFLFQPISNMGSGATLGVGGYALIAGSPSYEISREQFANSVVLKLDRYLLDGGAKQTDNLLGSDIFLGTLTLTSPVASQPTVKVNGVEETVGIKDIDTSKDWYWVLGSSVLTVGDSAAGGSDTIDVDYAAHDLRAYTLTNSGSVSAVGLVQMPITSSDSGNVSSPAEQANMDLAKRLGYTVRAGCGSSSKQTNGVPSSAQLMAGQTVAVVFSGLGAGSASGAVAYSATLLIQQMRTTDREGIDLVREFTLVGGPRVYSGHQFLSRIAR